MNRDEGHYLLIKKGLLSRVDVPWILSPKITPAFAAADIKIDNIVT